MFAFLVAALTLAILALATLFFVLEDEAPACASPPKPPPPDAAPPAYVVVFFGTLKGGSRRLAERLAAALRGAGVSADCRSLEAYDTDGLNALRCAAFVLATYEGGIPPPGCVPAVDSLAEAATDFRGSDLDLGSLRYAVFGCGNSEYPVRHFNAAARRLDSSLKRLGAVRVAHGCWGDDLDNRLEEQFDAWMLKAVPALARGAQAPPAAARGVAGLVPPGASPGLAGGDAAAEAAAAEEESEEEEGDDDEDGAAEGGDLVDVEDIGVKMVTRVDAGADSAGADAADAAGGRKQMVSPALRKALTKQGYKVVGSHSGVKLCRWTKAMLRGRGGCYKHTFYGIASYQCMEATPSLACANKCVFCWRHHDNPVGTSFRWEVDDPKALVDGFEAEHFKMIKQLRGVPGVKPERLKEALGRVRRPPLTPPHPPIPTRLPHLPTLTRLSPPAHPHPPIHS